MKEKRQLSTENQPERDGLNDEHPWAVEVGPSRIGMGAFAADQFLPGEVIGEVSGFFIDDPDYGSDYCINLVENLSLEPASPFCFMNHCCEPNVVLAFHWEVGEEYPSVWVEAVKEIEPGDELFIDYAWPADGAIRCECGSANCRGWVVAEEELESIAEVNGLAEMDDMSGLIFDEPTDLFGELPADTELG
jgi:uncharacterized protein